MRQTLVVGLMGLATFACGAGGAVTQPTEADEAARGAAADETESVPAAEAGCIEVWYVGEPFEQEMPDSFTTLFLEDTTTGDRLEVDGGWSPAPPILCEACATAGEEAYGSPVGVHEGFTRSPGLVRSAKLTPGQYAASGVCPDTGRHCVRFEAIPSGTYRVQVGVAGATCEVPSVQVPVVDGVRITCTRKVGP